jgi:hypothetical protein
MERNDLWLGDFHVAKPSRTHGAPRGHPLGLEPAPRGRGPRRRDRSSALIHLGSGRMPASNRVVAGEACFVPAKHDDDDDGGGGGGGGGGVLPAAPLGCGRPGLVVSIRASASASCSRRVRRIEASTGGDRCAVRGGRRRVLWPSCRGVRRPRRRWSGPCRACRSCGARSASGHEPRRPRTPRRWCDDHDRARQHHVGSDDSSVSLALPFVADALRPRRACLRRR